MRRSWLFSDFARASFCHGVWPRPGRGDGGDRGSGSGNGRGNGHSAYGRPRSPVPPLRSGCRLRFPDCGLSDSGTRRFRQTSWRPRRKSPLPRPSGRLRRLPGVPGGQGSRISPGRDGTAEPGRGSVRRPLPGIPGLWKTQVARAERTKDQAFRAFTSLQEGYIQRRDSMRIIKEQWADEAYAMVRGVRPEGREAGQDILADTTDAQGYALIDVPPGQWWVHAYYEQAYSELYWNIPITVERGDPVQVRLNPGKRLKSAPFSEPGARRARTALGGFTEVWLPTPGVACAAPGAVFFSQLWRLSVPGSDPRRRPFPQNGSPRPSWMQGDRASWPGSSPPSGRGARGPSSLWFETSKTRWPRRPGAMGPRWS